MHELTHHNLQANGIRVHVASCGTGPLVLLVHGFPESWYSWRHQLPALAAAGYRAVAMDVRGYGRSSKPSQVSDYRMLQKVADVVGVLDALDASEATLVGHDWGAPIVWTTALLRPDRVRGVAGLSVPYAPPAASTEPAPLTRMRDMAGADEFYIDYFQQVGRAEAEIEEDVRRWLLGFYWCLSGDIRDGPNVALVARGTRLVDKFQYPDRMPAWLSDADLDLYAAEFEYSGFFGPLGRYRNVNQDFEDLAAFAGRPIERPALFIGGSRDGPTLWGAPAIARFGETLPQLHRAEIIDGSGHWIQQERAGQTNALLLDFLGAIH